MSHSQYRDEKFEKALAALRYRTAGPWILALPRADLNVASKSPDVSTAHVEYKINAKENQVATMHVLAKGPGRVRLGYREHIPAEVGDLVLVNLREAGHWISLDAGTCYLFTGDVPFARIYRTDKSPTPPTRDVIVEGDTTWIEADEALKARREAWNDAWAWNIGDVLSDYVLLGRDPEAEREMRNGPATLLHIPGNAQTDGTRSDNGRDSRFPIVYRRVLGVGPGKWMTRETDLGVVDREECKSEAQPGDMMAMCKTVQAASFTFQGAPFEVIHAASVLVVQEKGFPSVEVHDSVPQALKWDELNEVEEDPDPPPDTERAT